MPGLGGEARRRQCLVGPREDTKSLKVFKLGSNVIKFHSSALKENKLGSRETSEWAAVVLNFPIKFSYF